MKLGSFVDGAVKGYQFVDEEQREAVRDKQRATAIDDQRAYREQDREDRIAHNDRMYEDSQTRTNAALDANTFNRERLTAADNRATEEHIYQKNQREIAELIAKDARAGYAYFKDGTPYPHDLFAKMKEKDILDRSVFSPIVDEKGFDASLKAGAILERLKDGDINAVNNPENLDVLNDIYRPQVEKGIGEFNSAMGGTIVSKRISEISASPKTGAIVAEVTVNLDNGKSYTAPITMNRSTADDDGVRLVDAKTAMDDLFGRYQRSKVAEPFRGRIKEEYTRLTSGANGAGTQSATGKTISDLLAYGISKAEAIKLATQSKSNPKKAATSLANVIAKTEWGMSHSPEEIYSEAQRVLGGSPAPESDEAPPVEGARKAPDGNWYVEKDGQFFKVNQ